MRRADLHSALVGVEKLRTDLSRERRHQFVLDCKRIASHPVIVLRPEVRAGQRIDELDVDAEMRPLALQTAFKEIARLSKGAWFRFDRNSAATLAKLLSAVAVFATGGLKALEARDRPEDRLMIEQMRGGKA